MHEAILRAAEARAAATAAPADRPRQRRSALEAGAPAVIRGSVDRVSVMRSASTSGEAKVGGYASVTESPYTMYDFFGPYAEVVSRGSFEQTLSTTPLVEFTVNHGAGGALPMAHTRNGTLTLAEDSTGLGYDAVVDPARTDVANLLSALARGDMAEASFKFRIDAGVWSPDYTEYRITSVDLERGDVSAVNFGANPAATSELRAASTAMLAKVQTGRALDAEDVNMLTQALGWLSSIDTIVDAAQDALASYLGVPNPDDDEDDMSDEASEGERSTAAPRMTLRDLLSL